MAVRVPSPVQDFITRELKKAGFAKPEYTEYDAAGNLTAVYCRDCGSKVKGWVDFENAPDGKIRQRFMQLGSYTEIQFKLTDGSFMSVAACTECASQLRDPSKWEAIMAVEMDAWARSIRRSNMSQEYMDAYFAKMGSKVIQRVAE